MSEHPSRDGHARLPAPVLAGAFGMFITIGMLQSTYGAALPLLRASFEVSVARSGLVISAASAGALAGVLAWEASRRRLSMRRIVAGGALAAVTGGLVIASAGTWPLIVAGAAIAGAGFGSLNTALNVYFAGSRDPRAPAHLNLLNACFGAGAMLGPGLVGLAGSYRLAWGAAAAIGLASWLGLRRISDDGPPLDPVEATPRRARATVLFVTLLALYVGIEVSTGGWAATHLVGTGVGERAAAGWSAGFFAALTIGRIAAAPLSLRLAPRTIVIAGLTLALAAMVAAREPAIAPVAYVLAGAAVASVFPSGFLWMSRTVPAWRRATTLVMIGGSITAITLPALVGVAVELHGVGAVPRSLVAMIAVALAAALALVALARRPSQTSH